MKGGERMAMALRAKKWLFLLPLGGILTALCLVLPKIGALQWFTLVPSLLWLFSRDPDKKWRAGRWYGAGVLYYLAFYLVIYHWFFYLYPMEFAGATKGEAAVLVVICWLGLSLLQTVFSSLVFPLFGLLFRTRAVRKWPFLLPFLFAAQYTVAEWSQTFTWMGVPWARLALGQLECGFLINSASLFGSYFLTFALVAFNGLLAWCLLHPQKLRLGAIGAATVLLFTVISGAVGLAVNDVNEGKPLVVAAVQGNVGTEQKWSQASNEQTYAVYEKYTAEAAAAGATVVVFPETFLPYTLTYYNSTGEFVIGLAEKYNVTILCGAFHHEEDERYNGMFVVYPTGAIGETVYAKRRLVPFGEFVPWRPLIEILIPPLATMGMLADDLCAGKDAAVIDTPYGALGGLICFDSIYEELTRDSVREGAQLLILPTNDSWFTDSAGVYMHEGQARLRAIESGRWIVRAADTGVSAVIDPDGNAHDELPPLVEGVSVATAYVSDARTLYSYIGNLIVYVMIAALVALSVSELVLYRKRRIA